MKYLWNRYTKFILTIIIFFCSAFFQLIPVKLFNINNITPKIQILLTLFSNMMNILFLVLMYYKDLKEDFKVFLENKKEMLEEGFKIWVIGLVLMAGSNVVINLFSPNKIAGNEEAIRSLITAAPYIMLFNTSILAPLIEEITFRKAFRDIIDTKWLFVIISGVVFGGLHVITSIRNAYDFLYLLPYCSLGIALSYMYAKTKNIFVSISMHALHNFLITFMNIIALGMIVLC